MSKFIIALDQGTTSSRSILYDSRLRKIDQVQKEFTQHFPEPGWVEHDADGIWDAQWETLRTLLERNGVKAEDVAALGIANQRETVVAWDKLTGKPLARAIVWQDRRTAAFCQALKRKGAEAGVRRKTGLVLDPYFSGSKMHWLLKHDPAVRKAAAGKRLAFGTVDSWLIWKLTGGNRHVTEAGNASRTLLMDVRTLAWDRGLLGLFGVPAGSLPEILASDARFGEAAVPGLEGVPIHGAAGDQQASLFGHRCFAPGSLKNTYGTGCFLLRNVGTRYLAPPKGLLGTVAWTLKGKTTYAHEGAVMVGGAAVQFLRDGLGIIDDAEQSETLAASLAGNEGVYFVPAFAGLGTPHWDPDARGLLIGLTRGTTRAHLCRAALESIAYQSLDLCRAFGGGIKSLNVDGGASRNRLLMQFQADITGAEVRVNHGHEVTALGVAMLAALGCGLIASQRELLELDLRLDVYKPAMKAAGRKLLVDRWREAVKRSMGWAD
ncbi:MAG TPA: glycerol kinase GlpK [Fibrobacteria bacterium]|nr:glycerol kinase GlpK [Fibrobacteria bacterium]